VGNWFRSIRSKLGIDASPIAPGFQKHSGPLPKAFTSTAKARSSSMTEHRPIGSLLRIQEVTDARFFINALFRRRFGSDAPDYPRHFVAFYAASDTTYAAVGYVHYSPFDECWLCGGLVIDDRAYRRIPSQDREAIRESGGIAEIMLRDTFAGLRDATAIWGFVGDKQSEVVCRRAGFARTKDAHVMVVWNRALPDEEKAVRLARVIGIGAF
jgi:hypothetical protein